MAAKKAVSAEVESLVRENERLKIHLQNVKRARLGSNVTVVLRSLIRALTTLIICCFAWLSISQIAGKVTDFRAIVVADLPAKCEAAKELSSPLLVFAKWIVPVSLVAIIVAAWSVRRALKLRSQTIRSMAEYRKKYEELIDPSRSSSQLSRDGDTNVEDDL